MPRCMVSPAHQEVAIATDIIPVWQHSAVASSARRAANAVSNALNVAATVRR